MTKKDKEAQLKAKLLKIKLAASTFKSPKPKVNKRGGRILNPDSDDDRSFGEIRAEEEVKAQHKAKLLKMKLAASKKEKKVDKKLKKIGDNHNRILKKELDARPLIKEVPMGVDKRDNSKINYFSKMKAENDAIDTGKKIRPNKPTDEDFGGIITAKAKVNKLKTAIVKSPDKYKVPREMKHTRVDSDGPLVNKVPFGEEDRETKQQGMDRIMRDSSYDVKNKKVRPATPTQADRKRIITAQEHHHKISFRGHKIGGFKGASLNGQSGKYAKYWLLNAKETNGNGWGIAAHTAKENMKKFIGRPLVVTAQSWHGASEYGDEYEHPYLPTNDINAILNHQEKFRVGSIVDVFEDKHGDWYASIEMLPKFASSRLPPFCSPAIYQLDASEAEGQISKWEALHLAALTENPAYGARIALLKGTCVGTDNECKVQFKSAKQESGIECPVKEKQKKVKSKISKLKTKQKISSLKQRLATVPSNLPTPNRRNIKNNDNPNRAIDDDVYFSDNPSGLNDIDPNRNRKRKPTSFDDKYDPNRLPMAEDFLGQSPNQPDRHVGDTVRDKLPNIPASRLEGTGPDTYHTRNEGESELSFKRWDDTEIEGHKFPGEKEVNKKLRSLFDGPFDKKYLHPSEDDIDVDTEVEWNLDEYHENQGDVPLKESTTTNVYDNSLSSIFGLAEEGFTGKYEDRFIVGDPRKWEQAKIKLQQYMPIGDNNPDDILNFMLDRGIDSFSNKAISDVSRKNAERFSKLKKKQKISKLKARLAYKGGSNYDRQITDLSKNFETQRNEITKRRPDSSVGKQPKNEFGHTCTNEATCGATSGFLRNKLILDHGLNYKQVKVEGGMYTGPGGEFSSAGVNINGTPEVRHEWVRLDDDTIIDGSAGQFMDQKNKINQKQRFRVIPPNAPLQKYYKGHYEHSPTGSKKWYNKNDPLKKSVDKYERKMRKGKLKARLAHDDIEKAFDNYEPHKDDIARGKRIDKIFEYTDARGKSIDGEGEQLADYINKGKKIRPTGNNAELSSILQKKLAKLKTKLALDRRSVVSLGLTNKGGVDSSKLKPSSFEPTELEDIGSGYTTLTEGRRLMIRAEGDITKDPSDITKLEHGEDRIAEPSLIKKLSSKDRVLKPKKVKSMTSRAKLKARLAVDTSKIKKKKYFNDKTLDRAYNVTMQGGIEDTDKTFDNPAKRKSPFENFQIRKKIDNSIGNNSVVSNPNKGTNDDKKASGSTVINSFKNKRMKKLAKLKLKLASLGEQNMTYQDSKKVKIHKKKHPEVRKAQKSVEDILRGQGRSVDGSHSQASFMSSTGDFIGGGSIENGKSHVEQILEIQGRIGYQPKEGEHDKIITDFINENKLIRVQNFPINRAGEKRLEFGINSKINKNQLRSITDAEKEGRTIGFNIGGDVGLSGPQRFEPETNEMTRKNNVTTGTGTRDMIKALRERKFIG